MTEHRTDPVRVEADIRRWLERAVIGLNLCPFAKAVHVRGQVRIVVCEASDVEALRAMLKAEMLHLAATPAEQVDTTLLVHPWVLNDFLDYNDFLDEADALLDTLALTGTLQVASFHPDYRFAGCPADDPGNNTNRAPYPVLHLLREASIDRAVAAFPSPDAIIERNIATMLRLGEAGYRALLSEDEPPTSARSGK